MVIRTVINGLTFDGATDDPTQQAVRDALIGFMAATAQAQAEATKEAQKAGIAAAKGDAKRYRGKKPSFDRATVKAVQDRLAQSAGASAIARELGVARQVALRIRHKGAAMKAALAKWEKREE